MKLLVTIINGIRSRDSRNFSVLAVAKSSADYLNALIAQWIEAEIKYSQIHSFL